MRVLIAPDKFREALDGEGVASAIAAGVRDACPDAEIIEFPMADGGEGTGPLLARALGADERIVRVLDPLARPRDARCWRTADGTGIVEMAEASGLALLAPQERDPLRTTSFGTGQLLRALVVAGCRRILTCVGGSATVDGGAGCLQALGWKLLDDRGRALAEPVGGGDLRRIHALVPPADRPECEVDVLCDVENPLLGPSGAAAVFGPQKGATPPAVVELDRGLSRWADCLKAMSGRDVASLAGAGAAGGLPAGMAGAMGASLLPGFAEAARHVGLSDRLPGCDLCLTGEGCIDDQTAGGKVVDGVARLARQHGVPVVALAGALRLREGQTPADLAKSLGVAGIEVVTPPGTPLPEALLETAGSLRRAAAAVLRGWRTKDGAKK